MTDKDFEQFKADVRGLIDDTDKLQAQIASLTAENERLTNENWRFQMGEAVMLKPHLNLIGRLKAENERLREALTTIAGPPERDPDLPPIYQPRWSVEQCRYIARAALQPKEGE